MGATQVCTRHSMVVLDAVIKLCFVFVLFLQSDTMATLRQKVSVVVFRKIFVCWLTKGEKNIVEIDFVDAAISDHD